MSNIQSQRLVSAYINDMIKTGTGRSVIEASLIRRGIDEIFVKKMVDETFKLHHARKRMKSLLYILIGVFILGVIVVLAL
jgi:SOS response regulatory protein OraA/RecX